MELDELLNSTKYLCFGGAGTQAICYVGAIDALQKHYRSSFESMIQNVRGAVGTSSGAIIALGMLVGIEHEKLLSSCQIVLGLNIAPNFELSKFLKEYGGDDGTVIKAVIETVLNVIGLSVSTTFSDFYRLTKKDFVCIATKVVDGSTVYFRYETTPDLKLTDAIFMSMSLPFLFVPKKYNGDIILDGVLSCNVPYEVFPIEETLVMYQTPGDRNTDSLKGYITALVSVSHSQQSAELNHKRATDATFRERSLFISSKGTLMMTLTDNLFWSAFSTGYACIFATKFKHAVSCLSSLIFVIVKVYVSYREEESRLYSAVDLKLPN